MARLKFGKIDIIPAQQHVSPPLPIFDIEANFVELRKEIQDLKNGAPVVKSEPPVDLGYLENAISSQAQRLMEHNDRLLAVESKKACSCPPLALPEVKQITHIKDVSKEVMEHVEANKRENKADYMCHANHIVAIEASLKGQKILNMIMIGAVILTILSRLF